MATRRAPGGSLLFRDSGTDGKFGRLPEEGFSLGTRKHVACSEGRSGRSLGAASKGLRGDDLRAGFRDRWHFPEDGPAGVSAEASKGGIRQGFGKVSKRGRGLSGTRVIFRKGSKELYRSAFERASGGSFEGVSSKGLPRGSSGLTF